MRLLIAAVGKLKQGPERELFAHYLDRAQSIGRKISLAPLSAIEIAEAKPATAQARMEAEAKSLLTKLPSSHKLICLDRGGEQLGSEEFAQLLAKFRDGGAQGGLPSLLAARTASGSRPCSRPIGFFPSAT